MIQKSLRCLACCVVLSICGSHLLADQWPQYRGSRGDGISTETIGETSWDRSGPRVVWKVPTPKGFSSMAISGGKAITLIATEGREVCLALDAKTGKEIWQKELGSSKYPNGGGNAGAPGNKGGDGPRSTPTIDDDRVYVYDAEMVLYCFAVDSGKLLWKQDIVKDFAGRTITWSNASSPIVEGSLVCIGGGGKGQSFLAFDKQDGSVRWKSGDETITHATPVVTTINGKKQLIYFAVSGLIAIDLASGDELWRTPFPFSTSAAASPIPSGNQVYCSAGYGIGASLFAVNGKNQVDEVWSKPNELMNHWSTPVLHDGHLYGIFEFKKYGRAPLQCVELATGKIKWAKRGYGPGNCILAGDKLIALSDAGEVVIVAARSDKYLEIARADVLEGKCWSTPALADGKLYVRSTVEAACINLSR